MSNIKLQTKRLRLRPCTGADVDTFHAMWTDPEIRRYLWDDVVIPRERAAAVVEECVESFERHGLGLWLALDTDAGDVLGFVGLRQIEDSSDIEALYGLYPAHWGKGLAGEALDAVLDYAFDTLGLFEVVAEMDTPNAASARVAERAGMRFVREYERNGLPTLRYAVRREERVR